MVANSTKNKVNPYKLYLKQEKGITELCFPFLEEIDS
jgi:hypothetical protein